MVGPVGGYGAKTPSDVEPTPTEQARVKGPAPAPAGGGTADAAQARPDAAPRGGAAAKAVRAAHLQDPAAQRLERRLAGKAARQAEQAGGAIPPERLVHGLDLRDGGKLVASIGGKERVLDEGVRDAWMPEGRYLAWTNGMGSGAGGFENEGEGLKLYDARAGEVREVLCETAMIDGVDLARLPNGKDALIVSMSDGGLGAPHLAIVDPERGEVARFSQAAAGRVKDGKLTIEHHDDTDNIDQTTSRETVDLATLLQGDVIVQGRGMLFDAGEAASLIREGIAGGSGLRVASALKGLTDPFAAAPSADSPEVWNAAKLVDETALLLAEDGSLTDLARLTAGAKLPGGAGELFADAIALYGSPSARELWNQAYAAAKR